MAIQLRWAWVSVSSTCACVQWVAHACHGFDEPELGTSDQHCCWSERAVSSSVQWVAHACHGFDEPELGTSDQHCCWSERAVSSSVQWVAHACHGFDEPELGTSDQHCCCRRIWNKVVIGWLLFYENLNSANATTIGNVWEQSKITMKLYRRFLSMRLRYEAKILIFIITWQP